MSIKDQHLRRHHKRLDQHQLRNLRDRKAIEGEITSRLGHSEPETILLVHLRFLVQRGRNKVKQFVLDNVRQWQGHDQDQFAQDLQRDHNKVEDLDNQLVLADLVVPADLVVVIRAEVELALLIVHRVPVELVVELVDPVAAVLLAEVEVVDLVVDQVVHQVVAAQLQVHSAKVRRNRRSLNQRKRVVKRSTIWRRQYSVA